MRQLERESVWRAVRWEAPWTRWALTVVEAAAQGTKLWWGVAALMSAFGGSAGRRTAAHAPVSMGLAEAVATKGVKNIADRARPPLRLMPPALARQQPDSSSFPSGHAAAAVGSTAAVVLGHPGRGSPLGIPAAAVAAARVHSGAHYPGDVVAGAVLGGAIAWDCCTSR
ncbi:phosphatase PAP2 family protein [Streptomyces albidoflavus]